MNFFSTKSDLEVQVSLPKKNVTPIIDLYEIIRLYENMVKFMPLD